MKKVSNSGFATVKTMSFKQLKKKLEKDGIVENLNHIEFKLGVNKNGNECIKYRSAGSSNMGVFASEDYLGYGEISKKLLTAKAYDLQRITFAELVPVSDTYHLHHSGLIFTETYVNCSYCMVGGKLPLQAPMSLLDIMLFTRQRYNDELKSFIELDQELLLEMENVDLMNAQGLYFEAIEINGRSYIDVCFDEWGLSCLITLSEFKILKEKGIDTIGVELFMKTLSEAGYVLVQDLFFGTKVNDVICEDCGGIHDKELVITVVRKEDNIDELVLGIDIKSTEDLLRYAEAQATYNEEAA